MVRHFSLTGTVTLKTLPGSHIFNVINDAMKLLQENPYLDFVCFTFDEVTLGISDKTTRLQLVRTFFTQLNIDLTDGRIRKQYFHANLPEFKEVYEYYGITF